MKMIRVNNFWISGIFMVKIPVLSSCFLIMTTTFVCCNKKVYNITYTPEGNEIEVALTISYIILFSFQITRHGFRGVGEGKVLDTVSHSTSLKLGFYFMISLCFHKFYPQKCSCFTSLNP